MVARVERNHLAHQEGLLKLWIAKTPSHLAQLSAEFLLHQIQSKPTLTLSCATGATPMAAYFALATLAQKNKLSLNEVHCFHLDEYAGMSPKDPRSYAHYIHHQVLDPLQIPVQNARLWQGDAKDPQAECLAYEQEIKNLGGIDCQILGLGLNGHIAFNEPGTSVDSRCHVIELTPSTLAHNAPHLGDGPHPTHAMTAGIATIMDARTILLLVSGQKKAEALNCLFADAISENFPASFLRHHPNVTVIADADAVNGRQAEWKGIEIHEAQ